MTYGEVSARLRDQLTLLLERHRIQARIGGAGSFHVPATTSHEEREQLGAEMQRYRTAVVDYCRQAVSIADPGLDVATRRRDPVADLLFRLENAAGASKRDLPLSDLMGGEPGYDHVRIWQSVAREAVVGERELAALKWRIVPEQARVVFKDTADLVRGLVVVDVRHQGVPGWEPLIGGSRLLTAAEAVSAQLSGQPFDHAVDALGWRPRPGVIEGPALPGLAGVVQAQHNVVVDLQHFPSATNLRTVLVSQADLSKNAARLAEALEPSLAASFNERATLYRDLAQASRPVGGETGDGRYAALESSNAARRLRSGPVGGEEVGEALRRLAHLSQRVDARVSTAVEHGFQQRLYFVAIKLPCLDARTSGGVVRPLEKWIPVSSPTQADLLAIVRQSRRPVRPAPPPRAFEGRKAYASVLALQTSTTTRAARRR